MIRILFVDHNDVERDFIRKSILRIADDIEIHEAKTAKQTFEALEQHDFDCILSDINMPDLNSFSFLQTIRNRGAHIPFIFMASQGSEKIVLEALRAGANDYFTKGGGFVHYEKIITRVRDLVSQKILKESRKENTDFLRDSEKKFRKIIDSSTDMVMHLDKDGEFTFASRACEALLGYKARELKNKSFFSFIHRSDKVRVRKEIFAQQGELEICQITCRFKCKSGDFIVFEINFNVLKDSRGKNIKEIVGAARDISEKEADNKVPEDPFLEEKLRLIDRINLPILIVQPGVGKILKSNKKGAELFFLSTKQKKPVLPSKYFNSSDDRKFIFNHLRKHGNLDAYDVKLLGKRGAETWYSLTASSMEYEGESAFFLAFVKINKRKIAEDKMEERNATLEETQKRLAEELKKTKEELRSTERDLETMLATMAIED